MLQPVSTTNTPLSLLTKHPITKKRYLDPVSQKAKQITKFILLLETKTGTNLYDWMLSNKVPFHKLSKTIESKPISINIGVKSRHALRLGDDITARNARHILIASTWRSGSTFLGDLLSRYPGTFYSYEPLIYLAHRYDGLSNVTDDIKSEMVDLISQILQCNPSLGYLKHLSEASNRNTMKHNFRMWNMCERLLKKMPVCFNLSVYIETCHLFPIRLIKTVRLRVKETERLLLDPEIGKALKVIVLVRDPRGVMSSRASDSWCKGKGCSDLETACNHLKEDILAAFYLKNKYPGALAHEVCLR